MRLSLVYFFKILIHKIRLVEKTENRVLQSLQKWKNWINGQKLAKSSKIYI